VSFPHFPLYLFISPFHSLISSPFLAFKIKGNRILWWKAEKDLDKGGVRVPEGQIILRGHAGKAPVINSYLSSPFSFFSRSHGPKENLTLAFFLSNCFLAGLTSPSPLEVKELGPDKASLLVCVFGRNLAAKTQERRSFMCVSAEDHAGLSAALETALDFKQS